MDINNLTREEALHLHKEMWSNMQNMLGDHPSEDARDDFKTEWCDKNFPNFFIMHNCFLCEYAEQQCIKTSKTTDNRCSFCPIDWRRLSAWKYKDDEVCKCYHRYINGDINDEIYKVAPISDILVLPEKENQ